MYMNNTNVVMYIAMQSRSFVTEDVIRQGGLVFITFMDDIKNGTNLMLDTGICSQ